MGATGGMGRSRMLARGNLGKIFLVGLIVGLITMVISIFIQGGGAVVGGLVSGGNAIVQNVVQSLFELIAQLLAAPIGACTTILLYYDLRIRKEGFDLEMLANSLQSSTPTP
jgi:hypothetical protein